MLSRAVMNKIAMTPKDAEQIGKSVLGFAKMITEPAMVENLGQSTKTTIANHIVTKNVHNYIIDSNLLGGTATIKTNLLAAFVNQNKQLVYPYNHIEALINNPKIKYHPSVHNEKGAPVRTLVEMPIISTFAERFPQIDKVTILGDNVKIPGRTQNTNRDLLVDFTNGHIKDFDIKTTKYDEHVSAGNIREISVAQNEIITYPRDYSLLHDQYELILKKIGQLITLQKVKMTMSPQDYRQLQDEYAHIQNKIFLRNIVLVDHTMIENTLMNINMLKTYPSNVNFYHIYYIKNGVLTEKEMNFLQKAMDMAHPSILDKPSYMQKYLVDCLHVYHQHVNNNTYETLRPLSKVYPFVKQLLINYVGNDI